MTPCSSVDTNIATHSMWSFPGISEVNPLTTQTPNKCKEKKKTKNTNSMNDCFGGRSRLQPWGNKVESKLRSLKKPTSCQMFLTVWCRLYKTPVGRGIVQ